jgi:hypothetical protein
MSKSVIFVLFLSLELIENNKPRVILDLSHQLEESDDEEDLKRNGSFSKRPILGSDTDSAKKDIDSELSVKDVIATITKSSDIYAANEASSKSHVNYGFEPNERF